jgi:hypothetical protein
LAKINPIPNNPPLPAHNFSGFLLDCALVLGGNVAVLRQSLNFVPVLL